MWSSRMKKNCRTCYFDSTFPGADPEYELAGSRSSMDFDFNEHVWNAGISVPEYQNMILPEIHELV